MKIWQKYFYAMFVGEALQFWQDQRFWQIIEKYTDNVGITSFYGKKGHIYVHGGWHLLTEHHVKIMHAQVVEGKNLREAANIAYLSELL